MIAVKDVNVSRAFYEKWFGMEVEVDHGENLGFKGGLSLQENFSGLTGIDPASMVERSHNMELYFECEDLDAFSKSIEGQIEVVHPIREYPWFQRVMRVYDPDHHILEVGESMAMVFKRLHAQGHSIEEVAQMTDHPLPYVQAAVEGRLG